MLLNPALNVNCSSGIGATFANSSRRWVRMIFYKIFYKFDMRLIETKSRIRKDKTDNKERKQGILEPKIVFLELARQLSIGLADVSV